MAYFSVIIKCRKTADKACGSVSMYENNIRFSLCHNTVKPLEGPCGDAHKSLAFFHYVKIIIGHYTEKVQNLVKHLAVLSRNADGRFDFRSFFQFQHKRSHFYGFRARAKNCHYLYFFHV